MNFPTGTKTSLAIPDGVQIARLMNGGGIGIEGPSRRPLQVVMAFSSPFGLAMVLLGRGHEPEVKVVFIWKKLAILFLSSLVWLDIEA
nr:hypothetical protein [Tanacetum cinerariifolium]